MGRLKLIDGLRGVAAGAVMLDHLLTRTPAHFLRGGYLGVAIFFVLSGFVIAMVIGERPITGAFIGRFALRRAVRLDIPYWVSIAVAVLLMALATQIGVPEKLPGFAQTLAHLFYLQEILGYPEISAIYWTLCYEVQFYLCLLLYLWLAQGLRLAFGSGPFLGAFLVTLAVSIAVHIGLVASPRGFMFPFWWAFGLGVLGFWAAAGRLDHRYAFATFGLVCLTAGALRGDWRVTSALTAALLVWAVRRGTMTRWLADPVTQFLGRISYSLYLFHGLIGWSTQSLALRYCNAWIALAAGVAASLASATIAYWLIERPSLRLSHHVPLQAHGIPTAVGVPGIPAS